MELWTTDEINKILIHLETGGWLFPGYEFDRGKSGISKLGHGASAIVFEAMKRGEPSYEYAIKVIGFNTLSVNDSFFDEAVKAQMMVAKSSKNVIRIYEFKQLWIFFDKDENIVSVLDEKTEQAGLNCLHLQFILMEKSKPVFSRNEKGEINILPKLAACGQKELLELARDIADALAKAHYNGVLHRDVKLENIFYSEKDDIYKLGDFGIAKVSTKGAASTVAFTKGYGAPEVVSTLEDKYDNTADIYSFGILLYLLTNNMRFPGSDSYIVNAKEQYTKGYVVTPPSDATPELATIITKLCAFRPDDRYQYMETVANELEALLYGEVFAYRRKHKKNIIIIMAVYILLYLFSHLDIGYVHTEVEYLNWMLLPLIPFVLELGILALPPRHVLARFYRTGLFWLLISFGAFAWYGERIGVAMYKDIIENGLSIGKSYYDPSMGGTIWVMVLSIVRTLGTRLMIKIKKR